MKGVYPLLRGKNFSAFSGFTSHLNIQEVLSWMPGHSLSEVQRVEGTAKKRVHVNGRTGRYPLKQEGPAFGGRETKHWAVKKEFGSQADSALPSQ